jgi:NAD-dependent dihydropyrimidine dehydrogenase PreA subunit
MKFNDFGVIGNKLGSFIMYLKIKSTKLEHVTVFITWNFCKLQNFCNYFVLKWKILIPNTLNILNVLVHYSIWTKPFIIFGEKFQNQYWLNSKYYNYVLCNMCMGWCPEYCINFWIELNSADYWSDGMDVLAGLGLCWL